MDQQETIVPLKPPAPTRPAVIARRRTLELDLTALRASAAALALESAKGKAVPKMPWRRFA
jgi:hypothetical protein